MPDEQCGPRCRGWLIIWTFVAVHNIWATGRRQPLLSDAAKAYHTRRPVLSTALAAGLLLHLSGRWPRYDPIHWLGLTSDRAAELVRRCR